MTRWFNSPLQLHRRWKEQKSARYSKRRVGQYRLLHEIGFGASGIVHLAVDTKTNVRYAIKEISKSRLERQHQSELLRQTGPGRSRPVSNTASSGAEAKRRKIEHNSINGINFREEFDLLAELQPHLNIIQFLKVIEDSNHPDSVFLVMEVAEAGVVMDVAPHSVIQPYKETECRNIFRQLVAAVNHLHENGIVHRDIKPQNLILANDNVVKLIDFGNATRISDFHGTSGGGSPAFMAPESLGKARKQASPTSIDVWAMGVTLYCLVYGHLPFESASLLDLYSSIKNKEAAHDTEIDADLKDLINKLLTKNPIDRITIKEIMDHPWLNK